MAEDTDHVKLAEVEEMFKQIMQVVKDCYGSLQGQQEKLIQLLEGALEVPSENDVQVYAPSNNLVSSSSHKLDRKMSPSVMSGSRSPTIDGNDNTTDWNRFDPDDEPDSPESPMTKRTSLYSDVIRDVTRRPTHNFAELLKNRPAELCKLSLLRGLVKDPRFDFVMGVVILLNSVYIGFEIEGSINSPSEEPPAIEYCFLGIYIVELSLRMWAFGVTKALENNWNCLDLLLVSVGSVSLFILEPVKRHTEADQGADFLQQITILRLMRLLRLVRSLRLLQQFKILWGLVNGLLHALPAILSTLALLFLLIFIFACGGVELVTKSTGMQDAARKDPVLRDILDLHFSTLPIVGLTLIRFTTMDSIGAIYEPLIREQPWLILYFVFVLLVVSITLMNLITAVLVEHSITMAKNDSDMERIMKNKRIKAMVPQIQELFTQLDSNNDGLLTLQEARSSEARMPKMLSHLVGVDTLVDLYEMLDNDHSGSVDKGEFVEGLVELALMDVPLETIKILHSCRVQKKEIKGVKKQLKLLSGEVEACRIVLKRPLLRVPPLKEPTQSLGKKDDTSEGCLPCEGHLAVLESCQLRPASYSPPPTPPGTPRRLLAKMERAVVSTINSRQMHA